MLYVVTQIRTTVKSTVGWRPGDVREWLPEIVPGEQPHQDDIGPESSKSGAGKSDLHEAAELGGQYEAPSDRKRVPGTERTRAGEPGYAMDRAALRASARRGTGNPPPPPHSGCRA